MSVINQYVGAVKAAPAQVKSLFTGSNKIKNIAFAAGGAVGTSVLGGILAVKVITPVLNRVGMGAMLSNPMAKRVVGGMIPFTVGFIANKFVKGDIGKALLVGGAVASIVEIAMPGKIAELIARAPMGAQAVTLPVAKIAGPAAAAGPVAGLAGLGSEYVIAPAYQGVGDYVEAPGYQAVGGYEPRPVYEGTEGVGDADDVLAGVGDADDVMAGVEGFMDDSKANYATYLN